MAGELGCVWDSEARLGGGVYGVDWQFGRESLRLDCHMGDLHFDRHRSVSEDGVARAGGWFELCVFFR